MPSFGEYGYNMSKSSKLFSDRFIAKFATIFLKRSAAVVFDYDSSGYCDSADGGVLNVARQSNVTDERKQYNTILYSGTISGPVNG